MRDYAEQVKRLRNQAKLERYYHGSGKICDDAADAIEELLAKDKNVPDKNVGEWISVEERLPEVAEKVLTYNGNYVSENWMCTIVDKDGKREMWAYSESFVTHWMPLPAPPKEGN